jgi:hypothetical protein
LLLSLFIERGHSDLQGKAANRASHVDEMYLTTWGAAVEIE